jgi:glycosyltransferase 2 family protein
MRPDRRTLLRGGIGVAVSVVAITILLDAVDLGRTLEVLGRASPAWILVMLATTGLDVATRGLRWQQLLAPIARLPYRRVLGYTLIGYLANNILPARLGELVRSHVLGEREGLSRPTVLGTVVVERVTDTALVVAIAAGAILILSVRGAMSSAVLLGVAFVAALVAGLALLVVAHRLPGAARVAAYLERWPRVLELGGRLRQGLAVAGRPATLARAMLIGLVAWGASILTFASAGQAVGIELTIAQAALICTGVALATIIPSGPGYLGTFELTAVGIATSFGFGADEAFAMALLVHAAILSVTSLGGVVAFLRLGIAVPRAGTPAAATE